MPPAVVTVMSTVPALSTGLVAASDVGELYVTLEAAVDPKATVEPDVNPVPVIVTDVPPVVVPVFGLTPETVGAAR